LFNGYNLVINKITLWYRWFTQCSLPLKLAV